MIVVDFIFRALFEIFTYRPRKAVPLPPRQRASALNVARLGRLYRTFADAHGLELDEDTHAYRGVVDGVTVAVSPGLDGSFFEHVSLELGLAVEGVKPILLRSAEEGRSDVEKAFADLFHVPELEADLRSVALARKKVRCLFLPMTPPDVVAQAIHAVLRVETSRRIPHYVYR